MTASWRFVAALLVILGTLCPVPLALAQSDRTSTLIVRVTGLTSEKAHLRIAVFNSERSWLDDASAAYRTVLEGGGREREWRIQNVPYGDYAVAAFEDQNRDGKLNRDLFGIPKEPYGFSNGVRGSFGPPGWKDAKFVVSGETMQLEIKLK